MSFKAWALPLILAVGLTGCIRTNTYFPEPLREDVTYNWHVVSVEANASRELTTTDSNGQMPNVDIIWREDGAGDVYLQVEAIMRETMALAASRLQVSIKGNRKVILIADVDQFHSLTERARSNIGGIHNVDFYLTVVDAETREVLSGPVFIEADVTAFGGDQAAAAVARGETMRVRIIQRVADVIATYLGVAGNRAVATESHVEIGR